jgi:hypothetical protein
MVGGIWHSFRQGDRTEYLAQYLLSGLGVASPMLRQEDIGYDFFCAAATEHAGGLTTFGPAFGVQIKSSSTPKVELGGPNDKGNWKKHEIEWLDAIDMPLLLGIVDKSIQEMQLFSTSAVRLAFSQAKGGLPAKLMLVPRLSGAPSDVGWPTMTALKGTRPVGSDGQCHEVDLGLPVISVDLKTLDDSKLRQDCQAKLRKLLEWEHESLSIRRAGVSYFYWAVRNDPQGVPEYAWMMDGKQIASPGLLRSMSAMSALLAAMLDASGKGASKVQLKQVLIDVGAFYSIPKELRDALFP